MSTNMTYGQVKLEGLGDVGEEYEDPDRLARHGQGGGGDYEPTGHPAVYNSLLVNQRLQYMLQQMKVLPMDKHQNDYLNV